MIKPKYFILDVDGVMTTGQFFYSKDGKIFSNGGRVLNATSKGDTLVLARNDSIKIIKDIDWKDGFYRNDIGWRAINKK